VKTRRLFVAVLLLVAVVLSGTVFAGFELYKDELYDREQRELQQVADQRASELDARLAELERTVRLWSEAPGIADHGSDIQRERLEDLVTESSFRGVSVMNANGTMTNIVAGLPPETRQELLGSDFSDRTYFQRAVSGETYISEPIRADSGNYIVTVSTPIRRGGEIVGTLNAALHISEGGFFGQMAAEQQNRGVVIVTDDGTELYHDHADPHENLVSGNATLTRTGWTVSVRESRQLVAAPLRPITYMQIGMTLAVVLALAGFGLWVDRRNLRQTDELLAGFERIADGEYGSEIDTGGSTEWERIRDSFNETSETLAAVMDERRERERELRRFRRAIEASAHAIFITNTDAEIEYVNRAFEEETGYSAEEAVGQTPNILYSGHQDDDYYRQFWETIEAGEQWESEIVNRRKSGETFHAHQTVAPITDEDGEIEAYVAIQTNVTERKERQRQLEVLDRVLRHNLNNDMNVVRGYAETIRDASEGTTAENAKQIVRKSDELLETVEKERAVTEVLSDDFHPSSVDVARLVRHVVADVQTTHDEAVFDTTIPESAIASGTPNLELAIRELVENAVVHNDCETPEVAVSVTESESNVRVAVADDGPGIPRQEREVLSDDGRVEPLFHGSGLGLWLVYWVVRRSRGTLTFAENEPRGSVVSIELHKSDQAGRPLIEETGATVEDTAADGGTPAEVSESGDTETQEDDSGN
jgi:PAS domain S-box-containing protein